MKYIVTYLIVQMIYGACPEPLPTFDEFGREQPRERVRTMALCISYDTTSKEKVFDSRKEATEFIKRGAGSTSLSGDLVNLKLDSVPAVQYNCQHLSMMVTAMGCPDNVKCNTATCTRCGKRFSSY